MYNVAILKPFHNKSDRGARKLDSNSVKIKVWKVIWILNDPKKEKSLLKNIITLSEEFSLFSIYVCTTGKK